jgi:hypothetical protein
MSEVKKGKTETLTKAMFKIHHDEKNQKAMCEVMKGKADMEYVRIKHYENG